MRPYHHELFRLRGHRLVRHDVRLAWSCEKCPLLVTDGYLSHFSKLSLAWEILRRIERCP
jgi:hypothetical protein